MEGRGVVHSVDEQRRNLRDLRRRSPDHQLIRERDDLPSCHGSGRRTEDTGFRDVTKTKASHHTQSNKAPVVVKQVWPATFEGARLATEVKDCAGVSADLKARLTREIIDHETLHATCTQTFLKKIRKQIRPASA